MHSNREGNQQLEPLFITSEMESKRAKFLKLLLGQPGTPVVKLKCHQLIMTQFFLLFQRIRFQYPFPYDLFITAVTSLVGVILVGMVSFGYVGSIVIGRV